MMNLVLMTQYLDMLKEIATSSRTNAILIPHSPGNLATPTAQMRNAMMEADRTVKVSEYKMEEFFGAGSNASRLRHDKSVRAD
jgi:hypothetical protein